MALDIDIDYSTVAAWLGSRRASCPLPVHLSSVGRWRRPGGLSSVTGVYSSRATLAGPVGVLGGVGDGVGRRVWASAVGALWALWRAVGRSCCLGWDRCRASCPRCCCRSWRAVAGPGCRCSGSAGCGGGLSAVQRGRVRLLCLLPGLGCVLRSAWAACLGCWRRCLPWMRGGIMAAGAPAVVGSCFRSGLFPKCIAGFQVSRRGFSRR